MSRQLLKVRAGIVPRLVLWGSTSKGNKCFLPLSLTTLLCNYLKNAAHAIHWLQLFAALSESDSLLLCNSLSANDHYVGNAEENPLLCPAHVTLSNELQALIGKFFYEPVATNDSIFLCSNSNSKLDEHETKFCRSINVICRDNEHLNCSAVDGGEKSESREESKKSAANDENDPSENDKHSGDAGERGEKDKEAGNSSGGDGKENNNGHNNRDNNDDNEKTNDKKESNDKDNNNEKKPENGITVDLNSKLRLFVKVASLAGTHNFEWPAEMICVTKTVPAISFSHNPLHFDYSKLYSGLARKRKNCDSKIKLTHKEKKRKKKMKTDNIPLGTVKVKESGGVDNGLTKTDIHKNTNTTEVKLCVKENIAVPNDKTINTNKISKKKVKGKGLKKRKIAPAEKSEDQTVTHKTMIKHMHTDSEMPLKTECNSAPRSGGKRSDRPPTISTNDLLDKEINGTVKDTGISKWDTSSESELEESFTTKKVGSGKREKKRRYSRGSDNAPSDHSFSERSRSRSHSRSRSERHSYSTYSSRSRRSSHSRSRSSRRHSSSSRSRSRRRSYRRSSVSSSRSRSRYRHSRSSSRSSRYSRRSSYMSSSRSRHRSRSRSVSSVSVKSRRDSRKRSSSERSGKSVHKTSVESSEKLKASAVDIPMPGDEMNSENASKVPKRIKVGYSKNKTAGSDLSSIPTPKEPDVKKISLPPDPKNKAAGCFIGPTLPPSHHLFHLDIPLPDCGQKSNNIRDVFQPIGPNDPLVFKSNKGEAGENKGEATSGNVATTFEIPEDQLEQYRQLQQKAAKHALQQMRREQGLPVEEEEDEEEEVMQTEDIIDDLGDVMEQQVLSLDDLSEEQLEILQHQQQQQQPQLQQLLLAPQTPLLASAASPNLPLNVINSGGGMSLQALTQTSHTAIQLVQMPNGQLVYAAANPMNSGGMTAGGMTLAGNGGMTFLAAPQHQLQLQAQPQIFSGLGGAVLAGGGGLTLPGHLGLGGLTTVRLASGAGLQSLALAPRHLISVSQSLHPGLQTLNLAQQPQLISQELYPIRLQNLQNLQSLQVQNLQNFQNLQNLQNFQNFQNLQASSAGYQVMLGGPRIVLQRLPGP